MNDDRSEAISSWVKVRASPPAGGRALRLVVSLLQSILEKRDLNLLGE